METNSQSIIEGLKEAGEELKASPAKFAHPQISPTRPPAREAVPLDRQSLAAVFSKKTPLSEKREETPSKQVSEEISLLKKIAECQQELSQEQSILEKRHQQIQELEKKIAVRVELLKKLQTKGAELNKEAQEFEEQLALVRKEKSDFLE